MTMTQQSGATDEAGDSGLRAAAARTLDRARDHLARPQDAQGWWKGELETNVTMDAEDLLMREFLGIRTQQETQAAARWMRSKQRADGTWANFHGGPPDLSTTVEAYVGLRLAGDPPPRRTWPRLRRSSATAAASRRPACSPASGWRCSASGRGRTCP